MGDPVKIRAYDASGRRATATATRRRVLDRAREQFVGQGYRATTVAALAAGAGVSPETVYGSFGSKLGVLKVLLDIAVGGDDAPVSVAERPAAQAMRDEPDPAAALALYAAAVAATNPRVAPLLRVLRDAAAADAEAAALLASLDDQRLLGMTMLGRALVAKGGFAVGADKVRDLLWALNSPEVYDLLVTRRGWAVEDYRRWLAESWAATLLGPGGDPLGPREDPETVPAAAAHRPDAPRGGRPQRS